MVSDIIVMEARKKRLIGVLVGLVCLGGAAAVAAWQFNLMGEVGRCLDWVRAEGAVMFFVAMAVLPFFGIPLSPFVLSAGALFAPTLGAWTVIACGMAVMAFNIAVSYWFAAVALRPWMERLVAWLGYRIPQVPADGAWQFTLLLRVVPGVPFFVQNYLLGLARVPFGSFLLISLAVPTLHLSIAVFAGDALAEGSTLKLTIAGLLFAALCVALYFFRKRLAVRRSTAPVSPGENTPIRTEA